MPPLSENLSLFPKGERPFGFGDVCTSGTNLITHVAIAARVHLNYLMRLDPLARQLSAILCFFVASSLCGASAGRTIISLDGRWQIAAGDAQPTEFASTVAVPGIASMAEPALSGEWHGDLNPAHFKSPASAVWYRRSFRLESTPRQHARLLVRAKYNARVILNGQDIGSDAHCTFSHATFDATQALKYGGENELLIRVGAWETGSAPSKEGSASWWRSSRCPGLWDSVKLELFDNPHLEEVKIVPNRDLAGLVAHITIVNGSAEPAAAELSGSVSRRRDGAATSEIHTKKIQLAARERRELVMEIPCPGAIPWTPGVEGTPELYIASFTTKAGAATSSDSTQVTFGFRTFEIHGADVLLNGRRIFGRAENIAFQRALLRWAPLLFDEAWAKRFLLMLRDEYGYNFIRSHLGHMPAFWYDLADELGLMVQDEWSYFHDADPVGQARAEARTELVRWVRQNLNHPSIVVWDNENEGDVVLSEIMAELRAIDPTRPWGEEDFDAQHTYKYSETDTDEVVDALSSQAPATRWETCRFWLNEQGVPEPREAFKTVRTITAWNFHYYSAADAQQLQSDLHADLGTYYRAGRFFAWAPFVVLSGPVNGQSYFLGDFSRKFTPQPNLAVLGALNATFGLSIEMWGAREWYRDRRIYAPGSSTVKSVAIWNDHAESRSGRVRVQVVAEDGHVVDEQRFDIKVDAGASARREVSFRLPAKPGIALLKCDLLDATGKIVNTAPPRRIMVAERDSSDLDGRAGFGGRLRPAADARHFSEAYCGHTASAAVQLALVRELKGYQIGGLDVTTEWKAHYRVRATSDRGIQVTLWLDDSGQVRRREETKRLTFTELPAAVQATVHTELGLVPVDEAVISRRQNGEQVSYEIKMVWAGGARTLAVDENGTLIKPQQ
jgi:hypothetical protein